MRAVFGGVQVMPDGLATGGDRYAQRLEEGRPGCGDRVPGLAGVHCRGLVDWPEVTLLEQGAHQPDT